MTVRLQKGVLTLESVDEILNCAIQMKFIGKCFLVVDAVSVLWRTIQLLNSCKDAAYGVEH